MSNKKVLVTGGTGFIGSALVVSLLNRGYEIRIIDNDFRGRQNRLKAIENDIELIIGDIRDESLVMKATEGMDIVYHLSFINGTRYFYEIPDVVLDVGVRGALNTLKASIQFGVKRYILASSSEVYQTPSNIPTNEKERIILNDITNPRYSYAGAKIISELLALNFLRETDTECIIYRPHNVFGPDMGNEHVIPELIQKIYSESLEFAKKIIKLKIQGSGNETRAFCYIDNAVDAIIICGEKGKNGEIYHIGDTHEIRILDMVKLIGDILGIKIDIISGPLALGSTLRRCPNISKIQRLGYKPKIHLEEGIHRTILWYRDYLKRSYA